MAFYSIEILQTTRNPRVLNLISNLSGLGVAEVKKRLRQLPMVVQASIPLSDAVAIERQLRKAGLQTRIVKSEVEVEDGWNKAEQPAHETEKEVKENDEIIVIPDEEVKILHASPQKEKKPDVKLKKIRAFSLRKRIAVLAGFALVVFITSIYLIHKSRDENAELEIILSMNQWSRTLNQQESLLDRGVTPQQILNKLTEIENKINYLISKIRSRGKSNELQARFHQIRTDALPALKDLEFRQKLEAAGYPIHPTCMVDLGSVRGVSDLPTGTLIRLQLSGASGVETTPYTTEIQGGIFELKLDPVLENYIYDAKSTVAPYSQQSEKIRKWAVENLALPPETGVTTPMVTMTEKTADRRQSKQSPIEVETPGSDIEATATPQSDIAPEDSSADAELSAALENALSEWTATIQNAQSEIRQEHYYSLLDLYKKLLELEARIDHLINLLRTDNQKNRWVLQREDTYGEFIGARSELQKWHSDYLVRNNPFYLETSLRRTLKQIGYPQAQVLVLDSPETGDAFVIELEINKPQNRVSFLSALAAVLDNEIRKSPLKIEAVKFRCNDRLYNWKTDLVRRASELLNHSDGMKRCADLLDPKRLL